MPWKEKKTVKRLGRKDKKREQQRDAEQRDADEKVRRKEERE